MKGLVSAQQFPDDAFARGLERAQWIDLALDAFALSLSGGVVEQHGVVSNHDQGLEPPATVVGGAPHIQKIQPEVAFAPTLHALEAQQVTATVTLSLDTLPYADVKQLDRDTGMRR